MTPPAGSSTQLSALVERLDAVISRLERLDTRLEQSESKREEFRANYERNHAVLDAKAQSAHLRIDKLEIETSETTKAVERMEKTITPVVLTNSILRWVAAIIGVSVVGLIWSIITGQVQLVFP